MPSALEVKLEESICINRAAKGTQIARIAVVVSYVFGVLQILELEGCLAMVMIGHHG